MAWSTLASIAAPWAKADFATARHSSAPLHSSSRSTLSATSWLYSLSFRFECFFARFFSALVYFLASRSSAVGGAGSTGYIFLAGGSATEPTAEALAALPTQQSRFRHMQGLPESEQARQNH